MIIDVTMTVLLPLLMAYALIVETFHEVAGSVMFLLFIAHHVMNRRWYGALPKGRFTARRLLQTVLDLALLVFMFAQPISGILMSKHLYTFLQIRGASAIAREVHLVAAYWGFVLLCVHAGTHLAPPLSKLKRTEEKKYHCLLWLLGVLSVYGAFAFFKRGLPGYMFLQSSFAFFDFAEPRLYFFADYLSIMILFAFAGYLLTALCSRATPAK